MPNAKIRMISVIGIESSPALARSSLTVSLTALLALASPNCSISRLGCRAWTPSTAVSTGSTRSAVSSESPAISNFTSAAWRSVVTWPPPPSGDSTFLTYRTLEPCASCPGPPPGTRASSIVRSRLRTKTASLVGRSPDSSSACSARWDSPLKPSTSEILFWLTVIPDDDGEQHEAEPAQDRGLAMRRAPAAHPARQVGRSIRSRGRHVTPDCWRRKTYAAARANARLNRP